MLRTKIVCTIGPASSDQAVLQAMIKAGMRVARLNFSHGTYAEHSSRIAAVREAAQVLGQPVAILLDTKGPEIRVGPVAGGKVALTAGQEVVLYPDNGLPGEAGRLPISYPGLAEDVGPGVKLLIDDGKVSLEVSRVQNGEIFCLVQNSGEVSSRKGVSAPGVSLRLPPVTEKEIKDLEFGLKENLDFFAISFVRNAQDVLMVRKILEDRGAVVPLIAKIENHEGVENIDQILRVADGVMVARGDLGVAISIEEVPLVQKVIIEKCNFAGKPVITATQMLDSMVHDPRPTRAEATDVANAVLDGTDAVMLSAETAVGLYPVAAVETMARIARRMEDALRQEELWAPRRQAGLGKVTDAISQATCMIAGDISAAAILTLTKTGSTARMVSRYRPDCPVIAATPDEKVVRQLCVVWGVEPIMVRETTGTDAMMAEAVEGALQAGQIHCGDLVVITAGVPVGVAGTTNLLKVHVAGKVLAQGMGIGKKTAVGKVRLCRQAADAEKVQSGDIVVAYATERAFIPAIEKCAGIVTEQGGLTSHAAIVGLHYNIPVIVGVEGAMQRLTEGSVVSLDCERGIIYAGVAKVL